jgi:hypothetical protein
MLATDIPYRAIFEVSDTEMIMRHAGVPVRVTKVQDGYEADFTALRCFVGDPGGVVRAETETLAIRMACDRIDRAIFEVAHHRG